MTSAGDDDWMGPFHGPYQQRISLEGIGFPGYDLRIGEDGQFKCWSMHRVGDAVDGRMIYHGALDQVKLHRSGKSHHFFVYQLWCRAVHGPPPADGQTYTVDHIDQNHANNNPNNVRWATQMQQVANRKKTYDRSIEWIPFTDDEERRQFKHRWFIQTGHEVRQLKKYGGV